MWQSFKRFLLFQAKVLEINYVTWKNGRAIARAYKERAPRSTAATSRLVRAAASLAALLAVVAALCFAVPFAARVIGPAAHNVVHALARAGAPPGSGAPTAPQVLPARQPPTQQAPSTSQNPHQSSTEAEPKLAAATEPRKEPPVPADTVIAPPPSLAGEPVSENMEYCLLANKATKILYFLGKSDNGGEWRVVEQCPAVMGMNEGQKKTSGDRRTPEGNYFIIGRKDGWELNAIYGPLAYVLNYPNDDDRKAGRTGEGIWIHGMPEDSSRMVTHGCIVLQNRYLVALSKYLKLGIGTPVVIVDKSDIPHPEQVPDFAGLQLKRRQILADYSKRQDDFADLLVRWKHAWETKDIDGYSRFYDCNHFDGGGLAWGAWREKKVHTFEMYRTIGISLDRIRVVDFSESTAVVVFLQSYESDVLKKQNAKKLSLVKSGGQWLITREETFSSEEFLL